MINLIQVMLSDGDLSSLENLKRNLELNQLSPRMDLSERSTEDLDLVRYLFAYLLISTNIVV